ncbi:MAG: hypothetical protein PSX42_16450 [bacterium]|nr:hypothetical protein [bacterium]
MILGFSTQLNKKPTYFVERIQKCFSLREINMLAGLDPSIHYPKDYNFVAKDKKPMKLHTIREDKTNRWKAGIKIDFFINVRKKDMFRFAPVLPVVSVQTVYMSYKGNDLIQISIGDKELSYYHERLEFAQNDGFDTWDDFFNYFYPQIKATPDNFLKMKLIHWTDKKY